MRLADLGPAIAGMLYGAGSETLGCANNLAHGIGVRKSEHWIANVLKDEQRMKALTGAVIIFAPSAGEMPVSEPLRKALAEEHPDTPLILCTETMSGIMAAGSIRPEPVLIGWAGHRTMARFVDAVSPTGLIITQVMHIADMPLNLISLVARAGRPVVVANGFLTDRDVRKSSGWVYRNLKGIYANVTRFCVQTEEDAVRVIGLGADPKRVIVTGNMRFDSALIQSTAQANLADELGLNPNEPLVVAGSTHDGEEEPVLAAFRQVCDGSAARLVIAPRNISRAAQVAQIAERMEFTTGLRSALCGRPQVIILDTIGELRELYRSAWIAFVGGTLVPIGGHNVLEPAALGKPVVFGPHTKHTSGAAEMLVRDGGAFRVNDGAELARVLRDLMADPDLRRRMGNSAQCSVESHSGALEACTRIIEDTFFGADSAP